MRYTVDRLEEGLAVLEAEDRSLLTVPGDQLPPGTREGDAVIATEDGFAAAPREADARAARIREKIRRLWK